MASPAAACLAGLLILLAAAQLYRREWRVLAELPRNTALRQRAQARVILGDWAARLDRAVSPEECWRSLASLADQIGFTVDSLRMEGRYFQSQRTAVDRISCTLRVPLPRSGYVSIAWPTTRIIPVELVCGAIESGLTRRAEAFALAGGPYWQGRAIRQKEFVS
jgi:hypothetical protein